MMECKMPSEDIELTRAALISILLKAAFEFESEHP